MSASNVASSDATALTVRELGERLRILELVELHPISVDRSLSKSIRFFAITCRSSE
jgi:hypothetical protein